MDHNFTTVYIYIVLRTQPKQTFWFENKDKILAIIRLMHEKV